MEAHSPVITMHATRTPLHITFPCCLSPGMLRVMKRPRSAELGALREERLAQQFILSVSPFSTSSLGSSTGGTDGGSLQEVKAPEQVPWTDLLLEVSMTAAFASLT